MIDLFGRPDQRFTIRYYDGSMLTTEAVLIKQVGPYSREFKARGDVYTVADSLWSLTE